MGREDILMFWGEVGKFENFVGHADNYPSFYFAFFNANIHQQEEDPSWFSRVRDSTAAPVVDVPINVSVLMPVQWFLLFKHIL